MASSQRRRTFRYSGESDDDSDGRNELDEQEQEDLISTLEQQNSDQNALYTTIFSILPLLAAALYLPSLFSLRSSSPHLLALLSITSLVSTAYTMRYIPLPKKKDVKGKKPMRPVQGLGLGYGEDDGPVQRYLVALNAMICALLGLVMLVEARRVGSPGKVSEAFWGLWGVPGAILGIVLVVRKMMVEVDVKELEGLRYEYKGA